MTPPIKASVFVGTSLDGFIARSNGDFDFLPVGGGEEHGYGVFESGLVQSEYVVAAEQALEAAGR